MRRSIVAVITLVAALLVASLGVTLAAPPIAPLEHPVTVRIAEDTAPSGAGFYIADARGYFKELGINVEFVDFESSASMLPAIAAGHVDVAGGVTTVSLFNAIKRGLGIKMIADKGTNLPGRSYFDLVLRKELENKIEDYSDLRGLRIAVSAVQSLDQLTLAKALAKGGLTFNDVQQVIIPSFGNMLTALANDRIDAAMQIEPLITKGVQEGDITRWKDATDFAPGAQIAIVLASPQFVSEKKEVARRFMIAYLEGIRDYYDAFVKGEGLEKILPIMTRYSSLKDESIYRDMNPAGLNPNGYVVTESIRADLEWYKSQGYFEGDIDLSRVIDHSLADFAVKVLGRYDTGDDQ